MKHDETNNRKINILKPPFNNEKLPVEWVEKRQNEQFFPPPQGDKKKSENEKERRNDNDNEPDE